MSGRVWVSFSDTGTGECIGAVLVEPEGDLHIQGFEVEEGAIMDIEPWTFYRRGELLERGFKPMEVRDEDR